MASVNVNDLNELMNKISSEELREQVEQVLLFFRMIDCTIEVTYSRENSEYYIEFGKDEHYFGSLCFLEDDEHSFSSIEVISKHHRNLSKEFLTSENQDVLTRRMGGIRIHKIKTERGHNKAIEVLRRMQTLNVKEMK